MKGKQLLLLLLLVAALGAAVYFVQKDTDSSWTGAGASTGGKVVEFPINDVTRVQLKSATGEVNLVRKDDQWTVQERGDYPANFEQVSGLLRKVWDLKTVQEVKVGPSQMPRLELVEPGKGEPAGTLLQLKSDDGKDLAGLLLGKKHTRKSEGGPMDAMGGMGGFPTGRYVLPVGGKKVSLVSETFENADPKPEQWLQKDFLKIENPKAVTLAGQTEPMRWKLTRETAAVEWKLTDAKPDELPVDTNKVSQFANLFSNPSFKDVLPPDAKPEETGLDKPATVTIKTFDGFTYGLKIGALKEESYPVQFTVAADLPKERAPGKDEKPEDKTKLDEEFKTAQKRLEDKLTAEKKFEGHAYIFDKATIDPLLKDRAALLAEKKPDAPAPGAPPTPGAPTTTPPVSVTTPPIGITTPPVSAPPATPPPPLPNAQPTPSAPATQPAPASPPPAAPAAPASPPAPPQPTAPAAPQPAPPQPPSPPADAPSPKPEAAPSPPPPAAPASESKPAAPDAPSPPAPAADQ